MTEDWGLTDYESARERQLEIFNRLVSMRRAGLPVVGETIAMTEHRPVITLGRHADVHNVIASEKLLAQRGIHVVKIERGGDVTIHAPGQLVVYPIIDLQKRHLGVKKYVEILEEAVIRTIADYGVKGERVEGATGVWIDKNRPRERKICAIGVKCSNFITMHGLALNVNTDISLFSLINPCGFVDKGVTSLAEEIGHEVNMKEVKEKISHHLNKLLNPNSLYGTANSEI